MNPIVEILQRLRGPRLLADLEELDAHLPCWRFDFIQLLRVRHDDGFRIVAGHAVRDDDDVERLHALQMRLLRFALPQVRLQDRVELGTRKCAAARPDGFEDALDLGGAGDVLVAGRVVCVEKVDVDAVFVLGGADWCDGCNGLGGFAPGAAGHGARVIDQEDGVKGGQESIRVVG